MRNILTACATRQSKQVNQDACVSSANAVVVADGLGSFFKAEVASRFAAEALKSKLDAADDAQLSQSKWFEQAFDEVQQELAASPLADLTVVPSTHKKEQAFGTTLLCAAAHGETLTIAYVGNGAILHLRGGFNEFPTTRILPWNALNYLNPHNVPQDGRSAMNRYIAPVSEGYQAVPTVLQLRQDLRGAGDILIVCSDGIHTADDIQVGRDSEGNIWQSGDQTLVILYQMLGDFLQQSEQSASDLQVVLERYLDRLADEKLISDDCTVGVLITPTALAYYAPKNSETQRPETVVVTEEVSADGTA